MDTGCEQQAGDLRGVAAEVGAAGHGEEVEALPLAAVLGRELGGGDLGGGLDDLAFEGRHVG